MSRFQITRRRLLFVVGGLIGLIVIIPVCVYVGLGITFSISASNGGFKFIGPDCNGVPIVISGTVQNANHEPMEGATVLIKYAAMDNSKKFSFTVETDTNGHFAYERPVSIFVCEDVSITVTANGFQSKTVRYSLLNDHREYGFTFFDEVCEDLVKVV